MTQKLTKARTFIQFKTLDFLSTPSSIIRAICQTTMFNISDLSSLGPSLPLSRQALPTLSTSASQAGTESSNGIDPGDTQSVYRPPARSQTLQLFTNRRPRRTISGKRKAT